MCILLLLFIQTLTIGFNHCNMIVHTWAKRYRGGCFSYSVSVDCHITVKCDFASSDKKYKNHGLFCFFVRTRHEWEFWRQNVTETWSIDDMSNSKDVIAGPEYTRLQKIVSFFFFSTLQSLLCKFKNLQKQVESRWLPKNRQKRQIA